LAVAPSADGLPDADVVSGVIREVARTEVMPRFQALRAGDIREKSPGQLVTAADVAAEAALNQRLRALAPGSVVLGEEAASDDPSLFELLDGAAPVWVIDPVDGTVNFAQGRPGFAIIVAWIGAGRTVAGWIHDPIEGVTVTARRGGGAWSDGRRLTVVPDTPLEAMTGSAYGKVGPLGRTADLLRADGRVGGVVNGMSSGIDYLSLALGRSHFQVTSRSLPWDHAAGVLIAEEAGALARFVDDTPYRPQVLDRGLLIAPHRAAWDTIRAIVCAV
jgi:fructose-1,6-bisphosphatase/inositol monophosphatase family enzyme